MNIPLGLRVPRGEAWRFADLMMKELAPHCERIQVVGMLRRHGPKNGGNQFQRWVDGIDLLIIPRMALLPTGLYAAGKPILTRQLAPVAWLNDAVLRRLVKVLSWGDKHLLFKYKWAQIRVWMADDQNWGHQMVVRTGSTRYVAWWYLRALKRAGYTIKDDYVRKGKTIIPVETEEQAFSLAGMPVIDPADRRPNLYKPNPRKKNPGPRKRKKVPVKKVIKKVVKKVPKKKKRKKQLK